MLKAVNANNIAQVKKQFGQKESSVPRVEIKTVYGYSDEAGVRVEIESSG